MVSIQSQLCRPQGVSCHNWLCVTCLWHSLYPFGNCSADKGSMKITANLTLIIAFNLALGINSVSRWLGGGNACLLQTSLSFYRCLFLWRKTSFWNVGAFREVSYWRRAIVQFSFQSALRPAAKLVPSHNDGILSDVTNIIAWDKQASVPSATQRHMQATGTPQEKTHTWTWLYEPLCRLHVKRSTVAAWFGIVLFLLLHTIGLCNLLQDLCGLARDCNSQH